VIRARLKTATNLVFATPVTSKDFLVSGAAVANKKAWGFVDHLSKIQAIFTTSLRE